MTTTTSNMPHFHSDSGELPPGSNPFEITTKTGYLPYELPLLRLPPVFDDLSRILDEMPICKADGEPGLLATFKLGTLVDSGKLPDLTAEIDNLKVPDTGRLDLASVTAAFRDYSFVASAYLLEPCWENYVMKHDTGYGIGRKVLPKCLAGPLVRCAEILDIPPFMSYAASYALYNYYLVDPLKGHVDYANLRLIRAFEKGLDPKSSEAGFVLTHIHMVAQTGELINGSVGLLSAIESSTRFGKMVSDTGDCKASLNQILHAMAVIEDNMEKMWANSRPKDYMAFRTFIYGITSQSMFPDGVTYEGQYGNTPQFFRGESGANDAIIPLLDHLCQIPMPSNPLTDILLEFREYRPKPHRQFLKYVREKSAQLGVKEAMVKSGDLTLVVLFLRVVDHVRSFRWRHWMFAREYILKHSLHPTATGGSPIITWLPNQLRAVMELMEDIANGSGLWAVLEEGVWNGGGSRDSILTSEDLALAKSIMDNMAVQKEKLQKEVLKYCHERKSGY